MRTKEARRVRKKGLKRAKKNGHVVATICESEDFSAYGCMNCNDLIDFWASPPQMNGPMAHRKCSGQPARNNFLTRVKDFIISLINERKNVIQEEE